MEGIDLNTGFLSPVILIYLSNTSSRIVRYADATRTGIGGTGLEFPLLHFQAKTL